MNDWLEDLQEEMYLLLCKRLEKFGATVDEFDIEKKHISVDSPPCQTQEVTDVVSKIIRLYYAKKKDILGLGVFSGVSDIIDWDN